MSQQQYERQTQLSQIAYLEDLLDLLQRRWDRAYSFSEQAWLDKEMGRVRAKLSCLRTEA